MKYAFDLDGTLDRSRVRRLATHLHNAGHELFVLTGAMQDTGMWTAAARRQKLDALGLEFIKDDHVHRCFGNTLEEIGQRKAAVLNELGIDIIFEDSSTFTREIMQHSKALVLYVVNNPKTFQGGEGM